MKRLCVFAHWDKDNFADDYVLYYLNSLKDICSTIVFVSDCERLSNIEEVSNIVDFTIIEKHNEYDFGSYKRGFLFAKENNLEFDELLFVNDSCYGPFFPLKSIFDKMSKKKCDFWGITRNNFGIKIGNTNLHTWSPHIQSYFLVFRPQVFNSPVFMNFINSITHQEDKAEIIYKYEIGLSKLLRMSGFKSGVLINRYFFTENCMLAKWKRLIKWYHCPFLKTSIPKYGIYMLGEVTEWRDVIPSVSDYPLDLIIKNAARFKVSEKNQYAELNLYRKIRFRVLNNMPTGFREVVIFIEKNTFKILNALCFNKLKKF